MRLKMIAAVVMCFGLSACESNITVKALHAAQKLCEPVGGLKSMYNFNGQLSARCESGAIFYLNPQTGAAII